ncbi:hypothetical protein NDU88_001542 [Pleurodeles waltl]|uniref:Uncharacterized protein n=1 Tax=Pleurodeles waltl TaxID=8319 RepID=A0AAV7P7H6_PLEWA|nr:hypothetical protein NDU88_001542 [Pleurodeles waltl]
MDSVGGGGAVPWKSAWLGSAPSSAEAPSCPSSSLGWTEPVLSPGLRGSHTPPGEARLSVPRSSKHLMEALGFYQHPLREAGDGDGVTSETPLQRTTYITYWEEGASRQSSPLGGPRT